MLILNAFLAILCAVVILALVLQIGIIANLFIIQSNPDKHSLGHLLTYPAGVNTEVDSPDGHSLFSLHRGSGAPVVLIHEAGLDARTFLLMWDALCGYGFKVITYDLRGHGRDTATVTGDISTHLADLEAVLDHHDVCDALLVGHSFGAYLAMRLLQRRPSLAHTRVRGVVSLAGYAGELPRRGLSLPWMYRWIGQSRVASILRSRMYGWGVAASAFGDQVSDSMIRAYLEIILQRPVGRLDQLFRKLTTNSFLNELGDDFPVPLLLLCSREDQRVHAGHSVQIARRVAHARLGLIDEPVGHMLPWEAPYLLVEEIRRAFPNRETANILR
ncbi:MAG: alpha/beta hydrolase [Bacteroidota bacterium]